MASFGETLRDLRKREGVGIKTLAPKLGVDHTYLSKLENDRALPSEEVVERIARYFRYDPEELLLRAGRIPDDLQRILKENPREAAAFLRQRFLRALKRPGT